MANFNQKQSKRTKPFVKTKKVVAKLNPVRKEPIELNGDKSLKGDSMVVLVVSATRSHQFTIHRPIGVTPLGDGDWVVSNTADVPDLLKRQKNPHEGVVAMKRASLRVALAVSEGLLQAPTGTDGASYPGTGNYRNAVLKAAKAKIKTDWAGDGKPTPEQYIDAIENPVDQNSERLLLAFYKRKEVIDQLEAEVPLPHFETLGGPMQDKPQLQVPSAQNMHRENLYDLVCKSIQASLTDSPILNQEQRANVIAPGNTTGLQATSSNPRRARERAAKKGIFGRRSKSQPPKQ
jgi:hypothetical protein